MGDRGEGDGSIYAERECNVFWIYWHSMRYQRRDGGAYCM